MPVTKGEHPMNESATVQDEVRAFYVVFRRATETFRQKLPMLLKEHPNEYVAILGEEVVDHKPDWKSVVENTKRRFPNQFVLIEHVVPEQKVSVDIDTLEG
jgi:hypothetical protein